MSLLIVYIFVKCIFSLFPFPPKLTVVETTGPPTSTLFSCFISRPFPFPHLPTFEFYLGLRLSSLRLISLPFLAAKVGSCGKIMGNVTQMEETCLPSAALSPTHFSLQTGMWGSLRPRDGSPRLKRAEVTH